jgi:hypothetical protein
MVGGGLLLLRAPKGLAIAMQHWMLSVEDPEHSDHA